MSDESDPDLDNIDDSALRQAHYHLADAVDHLSDADSHLVVDGDNGTGDADAPQATRDRISKSQHHLIKAEAAVRYELQSRGAFVPDTGNDTDSESLPANEDSQNNE